MSGLRVKTGIREGQRIDELRDRLGRRVAVQHGEALRGQHSPEYDAWASMIGRCYTKTSTPYPFYGGRGIAVCERWRDNFLAFLEDMGRKPSHEYSLERIDNEKDYEPGNCRWATHREQCRNRRSTRWITIGAETLSMAEWGERSGVDRDLIWYRLKSGWPPDQAIFTPPGGRRVAR